MQVRSVVLATRNPGKQREIRAILGDLPIEIQGLDAWGSLASPEETGATFAANAAAKALYYAAATGQWCLAEDSGLEVDALGGSPGVRSARYAADRCPSGADRGAVDEANNAKLLEALAGVPQPQRTARFVCHLALAGEGRILIQTFDTVEGLIAASPRGRGALGMIHSSGSPPWDGRRRNCRPSGRTPSAIAARPYGTSAGCWLACWPDPSPAAGPLLDRSKTTRAASTNAARDYRREMTHSPRARGTGVFHRRAG